MKKINSNTYTDKKVTDKYFEELELNKTTKSAIEEGRNLAYDKKSIGYSSINELKTALDL